MNAVAEFDSTLTDDMMLITDAARGKLVELLDDIEDDSVKAVRIFVSGGGCSGMTYGMTFTDERTDFDRVLDDGALKVYVDAVALGYLQGAEVDFEERPMGGASFVFKNAFATVGGTGACGGCGGAGAMGGGCA